MITLGTLAAELGLPVEGDAALEIDGVASLEEAGPRQLVFVRSRAHLPRLSSCRAAAVIAAPGLDLGGRPAIRSIHPGLDFARAARRLRPETRPAPGVHPSAVVDPAARVDPSACIGPGCWLAAGVRVGAQSVLHAGVALYPEARIGSGCTLHAGCVLRERSALGDRVILHPGVVLGADGFGYVGNEDGELEKAPQLGRVVVGDDVEIGANSCVDRGALGDTSIGARTKIDNLVQIGHNCRIGEGVVIVSQAGLAGSSVVRDGAVVMAQAGLAGHLEVGAGAFVAPQAGVRRDVPAGVRVYGSPAREERTQHRLQAALLRLPRLLRRVRALERRLGLPAGDPPDDAVPKR